ncbi:SdpI family protein [Flavobacterium limicola]
MPLLCGSIFIIVGFILYGYPPKKINYLYGYRTSSSMKNSEVWTFSQKYASVKMIQSGFILLVVSFAGLFLILMRIKI